MAEPAALLPAIAASLDDAAPGGHETCATLDIFDPRYAGLRLGTVCLSVSLPGRAVYCASGRCVAIGP